MEKISGSGDALLSLSVVVVYYLHTGNVAAFGFVEPHIGHYSTI